MAGSQLNNLHLLTIIDNNSNLNVTKEDHVYQTHTCGGAGGGERHHHYPTLTELLVGIKVICA